MKEKEPLEEFTIRDKKLNMLQLKPKKLELTKIASTLLMSESKDQTKLLLTTTPPVMKLKPET